MGRMQPMPHPVGERPLVTDVSGADQVDLGRLAVQQIGAHKLDLHAVGRGVQGDRRRAKGVDVAGQHMGRARAHRGDGDHPRTGGEIQRPPSGHLRRMVDQIARQGLAAGPGEGPERRVQPCLLQGLLGLAPDRLHLFGQVQLQFRRVRGSLQDGVIEDERAPVQDHPVVTDCGVTDVGEPANSEAQAGDRASWNAASGTVTS